MASNKCRDLLRQAHSSRMKYTYNALVDIRKQFMKTPKDVAVLVNNGLVKRLLVLIRTRDSLEEQYRSKVIDVSLSILSNMCMEDITRKRVLKDKGTGVTIIVELFEEVETECLQNRACRCLSNFLLDPGSWELVCTSSAIEKIVKLLMDTEKEECKQTCIRAIRLLGQTGSHVQKLVEKNAVSVVLKLIDSDVNSLKKSSLRCVHSLSSHGCTLQFASQVIASGKLPSLLTLVEDSNIEAFQVVIRLCEHHNFRAEFGNGGGITMFKDMFLSSELFCDKVKEDLLSVLCLCCKEAVNRVKLRDESILLLFIQALSEDELSNLHARIISAFVCFLYDQTSFDVLLENGLVPLLTKKLKNCSMIETAGSSVEDQGELKENNEEQMKPNVLEESELEGSTSFAAQNNGLEEVNEKKIETKQNTKTPSCGVEQITAGEGNRREREVENIPETSDNVREDNDVLEKDKEGNGNGSENRKKESEEKSGDAEQHFEKVFNDNESAHNEDNQCEKRADTRPVYSIDSPTYQPNIEWEYEDYDGAKCIERFTPPHNIDYSNQNNYSPLSNSSYYSPVESSPEYSPPSSPNTSPVSERTSRNIFPQTSLADHNEYSPLTGSQSPENVHPKYSGIGCRLYTTSVSPEPEKWSSRSRSPYSSNLSSPEPALGLDNNSNVSPGAVSPSPFDEISEDPLADEISAENSLTNPASGNVGYVKAESSHSDQVFQSDCDSEDKYNKDEDCQSVSGKGPDEHVSESLSKLKELLMMEERCGPKRKKVTSRNNITEYNILILLSRVSQMTNPTMHLVTKEVLHCLLDYISVMETPLARCPRLLSRIFRNPMCFNKILTYCVPTLIFDKLLKYGDLHTLAKDLRETRRKIKRKSTYGKAEIHHEIETDSDRFSMSDDLSLEDEQAVKRRRTSEGGQKQSHSFKGQYHRQEEDICDMSKSAIAFLEDLSGVVDSNYGRGVIDRLLHTVSRDQTTELCINVLCITWTQASRQYFFNQREVLDQVISVLQPSQNFDKKQFVHAVHGLRILAHIIDTKSKYQTLKTKKSSTANLDKFPTSGNAINDKSQDRNISVNFEKGLAEHIIGVRDKEYSVDKELYGKNVEQGGSHGAGAAKCCLTDGTVAMDTVFVVGNEKVSANRAKLVERSEIFGAMLDGHYSEASMSEIPIPESSKFALEILVHHLHGCEIGGCAYIDQLYTKSVDKHSAEQCVTLLEECIKYMVSDLYDMANECLVSRYIIPDSAFSVLKFAVLHRNDSLLKAAVSCIFYNCKRTDEVVGHLCKILSSRYAEIFLATLREILTE